MAEGQTDQNKPREAKWGREDLGSDNISKCEKHWELTNATWQQSNFGTTAFNTCN